MKIFLHIFPCANNFYPAFVSLIKYIVFSNETFVIKLTLFNLKLLYQDYYCLFHCIQCTCITIRHIKINLYLVTYRPIRPGVFLYSHCLTHVTVINDLLTYLFKPIRLERVEVWSISTRKMLFRKWISILSGLV